MSRGFVLHCKTTDTGGPLYGVAGRYYYYDGHTTQLAITTESSLIIYLCARAACIHIHLLINLCFDSASQNGQVNRVTHTNSECVTPSCLVCVSVRPIQLTFISVRTHPRPKSALIQPEFPLSFAFAHGAGRGGCGGRGCSGPTPSRCGGARTQQQAPSAPPAPVAQAR